MKVTLFCLLIAASNVLSRPMSLSFKHSLIAATLNTPTTTPSLFKRAEPDSSGAPIEVIQTTPISSPTSAPPSTAASSSKGGLSATTVIAIAFGIMFFLTLFLSALYFFAVSKKVKKPATNDCKSGAGNSINRPGRYWLDQFSLQEPEYLGSDNEKIGLSRATLSGHHNLPADYSKNHTQTIDSLAISIAAPPLEEQQQQQMDTSVDECFETTTDRKSVV